ncbi:MAG: LPD29 domain-containing protein [Phycisphaerales bacterium]
MSTQTQDKPSKAAQKIIDELKANRDDCGSARISTKQAAALIRDRLKREFAGVTFSVRKRDHDCVNISWTDGPTRSRVEQITDTYSFGGFDGMIDLAYSSMRWMHPDGTLSHASTEGTTSSRGSVEGSYTDCPEPGAFLLRFGPKYVFCAREISDERWRVILRGAAEYYGFPFDPDGEITKLARHNQTHNGDYVTDLARRWETMTEND